MKIILNNKALIVLMMSLTIISCKKTDSRKDSNFVAKTVNKKERGIVSTKLETKDYKDESFVLSCGSGCAMTYTPEVVEKYAATIKVKFSVKMYVDEVLSDTYDEAYIFYYDKDNKLENVKLEGKSEDILKTLMPDAQDSFKSFGENINLTHAEKSKKNCFEPSKLKLPYNQQININTVKYNFLDCNSIKGVDKYDCGENKLRYLSLPSKGDISVILVPQDCGDFAYRYYLLTIKNNIIVGNLYVEGEWYEPENYNDKELTSFSIDEQYNIVVKTKNSTSTTSNTYLIIEGKIVKKK
ncbi:hypothetical protein [Flavobacterium hungaricum]|uniref:Lipoprotein n=1 Tax=Flavobacterium hungaricum TaxID=2082725 RepID=A0ABR9TFS9_9FLAO|nr:hypothetical protein [Flavobacterium hungaricum]MBE8723882.1 hypothetical protein [Flavobacterium hungaricum]